MEFDIKEFEEEVLVDLGNTVNDYESSPWDDLDFINAALEYYESYYTEESYDEYSDEIDLILDTIPKDKWSDKDFLLTFIPYFGVNSKALHLVNIIEMLENNIPYIDLYFFY